MKTKAERFNITPRTPRVLDYNPITDADSYKFSHYKMLPAELEAMFTYGEARIKNDYTIFFGLQYYLLRYLSTQITMEHIDRAEKFALNHGEPFNRAGWEHIVKEYNGVVPIKIKAVPEGAKIPTGNILYSVELSDIVEHDEKLAWLPTYFETAVQRAVWYPTTIATNSNKARLILKKYLLDTSETLAPLPFMLHDFGARGVSCLEQAQIGGMAHLTSFMGSDTVPGVEFANFYYGHEMAAFSVWASEHAVMTLRGKDGEDQMIDDILNAFIEDRKGKPGPHILSLVLDGYNIFDATKKIAARKDKIIAAGIKVVVRPDSGKVTVVPLEVMKLNDLAWGFTENKKHYRVAPPNIGELQGDGIDNEAMEAVLFGMKMQGFSAENIVFGSGGGLLQKVNRDTYKFAQKASAAKLNGVWQDVYKDPATDPGKVSKKGRLSLFKHCMTGEYRTIRIDDGMPDGEWIEVLETVWDCGKLLREYTSFEEIRQRVWSHDAAMIDYPEPVEA